MSFQLVDNAGWKIVTPSREWVTGHKRALLPHYFTNKHIGGYSTEVYNYYYATYKIDENEELALFINFPYSFHIRKTILGEDECATVHFEDNALSCEKIKGEAVVIGINIVSAEFDNTSVFFLTKKNKIQGDEVKYYRHTLLQGEKLAPAIYELSSDEVISEKQTDKAMGKPWPFSSFFFVFDDMTCTDYENAIFIIDGLYRHGKKIPPLKVHINYFDFNAVPEYRGKDRK